MAKVAPISEQFQHFLKVFMRFLGSLYERTKQAWKRFWMQTQKGRGIDFAG